MLRPLQDSYSYHHRKLSGRLVTYCVQGHGLFRDGAIICTQDCRALNHHPVLGKLEL